MARVGYGQAFRSVSPNCLTITMSAFDANILWGAGFICISRVDTCGRMRLL